MEVEPAKYARAGEALGLDLHGRSPEEGTRKTLDHLRQWERDLGTPRLRDIPGVDPDEFDYAAQGALANVAADSQPRPTGHADYVRMFTEAYDAR